MDESSETLNDLLNRYCITKFEVTNKRYGCSLRYGDLKILYVYDRFISDASEFERFGYGIVHRSSDDESSNSYSGWVIK